MNYFIPPLVAIFVGATVLSVIDTISNTFEINECRQLAQYATDYDSFYLTQYQNDMCTAHDIIINAPVK